MDALRRIVRVLSSSARDVAAGRNGVTGAQLFVLRQIGDAPGLSLRELATRTLAGQSTVSEVVSRLVDRELVTRSVSDADARQAVLTLTARGKRAIAGVEITAQERLATGLAKLSLHKRRALATALEEWLDAAGLGESPVDMFFEGGAPRARRKVSS